MTNREFLNTIATTEALSDEIKAFATAEIAKMDKRNAKRSSKPSKTAIANEPIKAAILEVVGESETAMTAADLGVACEISTQKASALAVQLVKEGKLTAVEVKVKGKGKVKGYTLADADTDTEDEVDE